MPKIQILIVDDHDLFREGLVRLLEEETDFSTIQCATVQEAVGIVAKRTIDIVLLDYDLGLARGSEFLIRARENQFEGRILVVTAGLNAADAAQLLRDGVAGIFHKQSSPASLARCIRRVMDGEAWIDHRYLNVLMRAPDPERDPSKPVFSERERAVLRGVFEGLANKEIANRLSLSETSVKASLHQLFDRMGVRTRGQLVRIALEQYRDQL